MSCDALNIATSGLFACAGNNCNPCSIASMGLFTYGEVAEEVESESGGGSFSKARKEIFDEFIERDLEQRVIERDGVKVAVTSPSFITQKESQIEFTALPLKSIPNSIDQEIAREIRKMIFLREAEVIFSEAMEQQEFDEEVIAVMLMSEA